MAEGTGPASASDWPVEWLWRLHADQQIADFLNAVLLIFNPRVLCIFIVEIRCRASVFFSYSFNQCNVN